MGDLYPNKIFFPMAGRPSCGTIVYSASPLEEVASSSSMEQPAVRILLGGVAAVLVPADVPGPQNGVGPWVGAIAGIGHAAAVAVGEGLPVVVAGDFNAVQEHLPFRRLLDGGLLVDATVESGAGWLPTYRADGWYPPLIQIDHVLVSPGISVGRVESVEVGQNAHRALIAWLRVG